MTDNRKFAAIAAAAALFGAAFTAGEGGAATISGDGFSAGVGQSLTAVFSCPAGTECQPGQNETFDADLSATMVITLLGTGLLGNPGDLDADQWRLQFAVTNTSSRQDGDPDNANRLTAFAFGTDPELAAGNLSDVAELEDVSGVTWNLTDTGQFPGFGGLFEFCTSSGNTCAGGASGGLYVDATSTFNLTLRVAQDTSNLNFDFLGARFQSVEQDGGFEGSTTVQGTVIPLPAAGWLLLSGLGAIGVLGHRRRKQAA